MRVCLGRRDTSKALNTTFTVFHEKRRTRRRTRTQKRRNNRNGSRASHLPRSESARQGTALLVLRSLIQYDVFDCVRLLAAVVVTNSEEGRDSGGRQLRAVVIWEEDFIHPLLSPLNGLEPT